MKHIVMSFLLICSALMALNWSSMTFSKVLPSDQSKTIKDHEQSSSASESLLSKHNNLFPMGIGLRDIADWSTQFPFIDLMKQSRTWRNWEDKKADPNMITQNKHGWVTSLKPGQTAGTIFMTTFKGDPLPFKRLFIFYEGKGKIEYPWKGKKVSHESKPGLDVIEVEYGNHLLTITEIDIKNPLRNIRIIPESLLKNHLDGEIFNPKWLSRIESFPAVRFMDWMKTNNSKQQYWHDRPQVLDRTWAPKGVPLEIMLQLSSVIDSDPWFNIPHLADDDYILNFAKVVKKYLKDNLQVYIEHSNETWNWQFKQSKYANIEGRALWGEIGSAYMQWQGMRTAKVCNIFKQNVFLKNTSKIQCVLGVHPGGGRFYKEAADCPQYAKAAGKTCIDHGVDHIAVTTYFHGGLNGPYRSQAKKSEGKQHQKLILEWASSGEEGVKKAFEQLLLGKHLRHVGKWKDYKGVYADAKQKFTAWNLRAKALGVGLIAYEGGPHITAAGHALQEEKVVQDFHIAVNRDPLIGQAYSEVLRAWQESEGGLHMHFVDISKPSKWGSWGALENLFQPTSPKWKVIQHYLEKN